MIYFLRSATVAPGKIAAALSYAREVAELVRAKTGREVTIGVPIGGHANRIGWFIQYDNLAALENEQTKLLQDSEYMATVTKGGENFVPGSLYDNIWRML